MACLRVVGRQDNDQAGGSGGMEAIGSQTRTGRRGRRGRSAGLMLGACAEGTMSAAEASAGSILGAPTAFGHPANPHPHQAPALALARHLARPPGAPTSACAAPSA